VRGDCVDEAAHRQHLGGAGVDPAAARLPVGCRLPLDDRDRDPREGQLARQHEARGSGADDDHLRSHTREHK
jgi:hypothetical protein